LDSWPPYTGQSTVAGLVASEPCVAAPTLLQRLPRKPVSTKTVMSAVIVLFDAIFFSNRVLGTVASRRA
jgi:hypothetical protein